MSHVIAGFSGAASMLVFVAVARGDVGAAITAAASSGLFAVLARACWRDGR